MLLGILIFLVEAFNTPLSEVKLGSVSLNALITVLLLFFCLFGSLQLRIPVPHNRTDRISFQFLLVFVALIFLHVLLAGKIEGARTFNILSVVTFTFLILAVYRSNAVKEWDLRKLHRFIVLGLLMSLGLYFIQQAAAIGGSPRSEAAYLVVCLAWVLGAMKYKVCTRSFGLFLTGAILVTIALMLSRTALFTSFLLVGLSISNPQKLSLGQIIRGSVLLGGTVAIFIFTIVNYAPLYDRFFAGDLSIEYGAVQINAMGRTNMWTLLLESMDSFPIIGKGAGASSELLMGYYGAAHAHNDYLRVLYDFGIGGLVFWVGFLIFAVLGCLRNWRRSVDETDRRGACHVAAFLGLVAFILLMITDNVILYGNMVYPLGVLIGLSLSLGKYPVRPRHAQPYSPATPLTGYSSVE